MHDRSRIFLAANLFAVLLLIGSWPGGTAPAAALPAGPFADESLTPLRQQVETKAVALSGSAAERVDRLLTWIEKMEGSVRSALKSSAAPKAQALPTGQAGTVQVRDYLNFRTSPNGPVISRLHGGDRVEILGRQGSWYRIRVGNRVGYAFAKYITQGAVTTTAKAGKTPAPVTSGVPAGSTPAGRGAPMNVKATGYYPPPPGGYKTKAEARLEGGAYDCRGQKLRTLQQYNAKDPKAYVSCATDPRVIKTGTYFTIDQFPGVRFLACDVGGGIKGQHVDICCQTKADAYRLPARVTVRTLT
ncbi:MAG: SH3 domain-containing protein [Candidatus Riflebacteria bacterium]|nr:SH3 domain-containing protein [Candidatus Riflebacteria bacterium]